MAKKEYKSVYVLIHGYPYEGSDIVSVESTIEDAKETAKKHFKSQDVLGKYTDDWKEINNYKWKCENEWSYYIISEFRVGFSK